MSKLQVVQVALTTRDLPATLRFYSEIFGFANSGGIPIWGDSMSLQGLAPSARAMMWWMVDGQPFFQVEVFAHTEPFPQPKQPDWRASDHGWVRFGVTVDSLAPIERVLSDWSVPILGEHQDKDGTRRIAFFDPTSSALLEVIEAEGTARPTVRYATYSTADIPASRHLYADVLGFPILDRSLLHGPEHEALWGLADAEVDGFLVGPVGSVQIEVVRYRTPVGRPKRADACITDLGIMNIALGAEDDGVVRQAISRVQSAGYATTPLFGEGGSVVTYLTEAGSEIELIAVPKSAAAQWGYHPTAPFLGASE